MTDLSDRKNRHIDAVLSGQANARGVTGGFETIRFEHCALPELDLHEIDLSTSFLGKPLRLPFLISSMTGGPARAAAINATLAEAAQTLGIALAVGSQRVALTTGESGGIDATLRRLAPDIPLYANIGAGQLQGDFGPDTLQRAVDMIEADALIIHLNPVQEALQLTGDTRWTGLLAQIDRVCRALDIPVIIKEVGFGISGKVAERLAAVGVSAIDVAGAGGTSWSAVEGVLREDSDGQDLAELFRDWGIPTAMALSQVHTILPDMPLIGSGGIRSGLDAARAIRLGAGLCGQAGGVLAAAVEGVDAVISHFERMEAALRLACFATGSANLAALRKAPLL